MSQDNWDEAEEISASWFTFDEVGKKIKGTLLSKTLNKEAEYGPQWVYELCLENGEVWNVGINASKKGTIQRINRAKIGEIIGIIYEKDGESNAGRQPAKYLKVLTWGMDPNFSEFETGKEVGEEVRAEDIPM